MNAPAQTVKTHRISIREEKRLWLYLIAQLISLTFTLLQNAALCRWAVEKVGKANSGPVVGLISALGLVLGALLGPIFGHIIDRSNKHRVLLLTSSLGFVQAALLSYLCYINRLTLAGVYQLALFGSLISAADVVIRNAYVRHIVEEHNVHRAVGFFVTLYNFALMLGPGLVDVLLKHFGFAGVFGLNALSFLVLLALVWNIAVPHVSAKNERVMSLSQHLRKGARYVFIEDSQVRTCIILIALMSIFGMTCNSMLSVISANMFKDDRSTFGLLARTLGLGSLVGSVLTIAFSKRWPRTFIVGGLSILGLSQCMLSQLSIVWQGQVALFMVGVGLMMCFSTTQSLIQTLGSKKHELPGTTIGWRNSAFFGGWMLGSYILGHVAKMFGCPQMLLSSGCAMVMVGIIILVVNPDLTVHKE